SELLEAENRLISDYLHGRLESRENELFEQRYLATPSGRQKFNLAYLLHQSGAAKSVLTKMSSDGATSFSQAKTILASFGAFKPMVGLPAVGVLLIIAAIGFQVLRQSQAGSPIASESRTATDMVGATISPDPTISQASSVARIELHPTRDIRSETTSNPTLKVNSTTHLIELKLKLSTPIYTRYRGKVLDKERNMAEVGSKQSLIPEGDRNDRFVLWKLAAAILPQGDYQIELRGMNASGETGDVSSYDLQVRDR